MTVERRTRRRPPAPSGPPAWLRNGILILTMTVWSVVVGAYLKQGKLPDAPLLGIPGAVYLALSPPMLRRRGQQQGDEEEPT